MLDKLAPNPPQTLLIEGGTEKTRLELALYWAMGANCPEVKNGAPCLKCTICKQTEALAYLDLHLFDGRISNKCDEENPGPVKALRMENIRSLKQALGTVPRGRKRVTIIQGLVQAREEASNSLLKTLEEPVDNALFVLLTPLRNQLLPTLVSRSICVALPWTNAANINDDLRAWEEEISQFLGSGQGLLPKLGNKGAINADIANDLILACQRALAQALGQNVSNSPILGFFSHLAAHPELAFQASQWLSQAQEMVLATVNPARVLEALFTRLYLLPKG